MIDRLSPQEVVACAAVFLTVFLATCKLIAHFDDQYKKAAERASGLSAALDKLIGRLDKGLRICLERYGSIFVPSGFRTAGGHLDLGEQAFSLLPLDAYRKTICELAPQFSAFHLLAKRIRHLAGGFRLLWFLALMELVALLGLAAVVCCSAAELISDGISEVLAVIAIVFLVCVLVVGLVMYVILKSIEHRTDRTAELLG